MRIIEPSVEILEKVDVKSPYTFLEKIGRTCYKSEAKEGGALDFCVRLEHGKHYAILEHYYVHLMVHMDMFKNYKTVSQKMPKHGAITMLGSTMILTLPLRTFLEEQDVKDDLLELLVKKVAFHYPQLFRVQGLDIEGIRILSDEELLEVIYYELKYLNMWLDYRDSEKEVEKHLTHTFHITCDRGVTHELVRHRLASFAQESTRYCNYSKDKFGNEITVIRPQFFEEGTESYNIWKASCLECEKAYFNLLNYGCSPQEARSVLPNSLKTEIMITATEEEWQHILNLRYLGTTGAPHPQVKQIMQEVFKILEYERNRRYSRYAEYR